MSNLYWPVLKIMDAGYCLYVHIVNFIINSCQTSGFSRVGAIIKYNIMHFPVLIKTVLKLVYIICKAKAKQRCVMGAGMCLYAQLVQTKNKQCKSAIILQCYHPHSIYHNKYLTSELFSLREYRNKLLHIAGMHWNALPTDIKLISSRTSFCKKLKTHIFSLII